MTLKCASPGCPYLVHSNADLGGYCCRRCFGIGSLMKVHPQNHSSKCEKVLAPEDACRSCMRCKPKKLPKKRKVNNRASTGNLRLSCASVETGNSNDPNEQDTEQKDVLESIMPAQQDMDTKKEKKKTNKIKKVRKTISEGMLKSTEVAFDAIEASSIAVAFGGIDAMDQASLELPTPISDPQSSMKASGIDNRGGEAAGNARKLFREASELLQGAKQMFDDATRNRTKCLSPGCTSVAHTFGKCKGYCCKSCQQSAANDSTALYTLAVAEGVINSSKCERDRTAEDLQEIPGWF